MNILILSAGTRNKIVQYFKENTDGKVIATDCSHLASAIYEADDYYIVKRMNEEGYLEQIIEICIDEKVDFVFSLIDPELQLLADNRKLFDEINVLPIVSSSELVEICADKFLFYEELTRKGYKTVKTYSNFNNFLEGYNLKHIEFPVFIKPRYGSASIGISMINNIDELKLVSQNRNDIIIQEYINGQEIGVDVYIDLFSNEIKGYFAKEKIRMRAGETDKSTSYDDPILRTLVEKFCAELGFIGFIDIDIFKVGNDYYISEVNPRFGGGYPHAYELGINFPILAINNVKGFENSKSYTSYEEGISMIKYSDVKIIKPANTRFSDF